MCVKPRKSNVSGVNIQVVGRTTPDLVVGG
jgi:hypothetical protein